MRNAKGICDASGFEFPLRELVKQWDGALVHPRYADIRNPQDFVRGVRESALPYSRPEAPDRFLPGLLTSRDLVPLRTKAVIGLTGKEVVL